MKYVGVDLHKKVIVLCVVTKDRRVLSRKRLACGDPAAIRGWFAELGPCEAVVEATASFEWFVQLIEPLCCRVVLAHPKKMRIIAESVRKTDKLDAQALAELLALDVVPMAHRASPRLRQHRALVRERHRVRQRGTAVKVKLRRCLDNYNADRPDLFSEAGKQYVQGLDLLDGDRFVVEQLFQQLEFYATQLATLDRQLRKFADTAPVAEAEARRLLDTIPTFGPVTIDVILSELGDVARFRSQKRAVAYAGLAPGVRQSAGKTRQLHISKEGSGLLRWALVEAAWRLVNKTRRWAHVYEQLRKRCGAKKAIVAIARRLLCVVVGMLQRGETYREHAGAARRGELAPREDRAKRRSPASRKGGGLPASEPLASV
jgi:transposase